ncbi:MAG: hypothetical protein JJU45_07460 [Acidimicrobiia bacterium]|nr:hypothetical protein [Acidimicrobiia bacterium]
MRTSLRFARFALGPPHQVCHRCGILHMSHHVIALPQHDRNILAVKEKSGRSQPRQHAIIHPVVLEPERLLA